MPGVPRTPFSSLSVGLTAARLLPESYGRRQRDIQIVFHVRFDKSVVLNLCESCWLTVGSGDGDLLQGEGVTAATVLQK